ncbi:MAG: hypothetical protein AAGD43_03405 [Pseudomonadota bacterium]
MGVFATIASFLATGFGRAGIIVGGAATFLGIFLWDYNRIKSAEIRGGQKVKLEVKNANENATNAGRASADSSGKPGIAGVRSPRYRD